MTTAPTPTASARPGDGPIGHVAGARAAQVLSARLPHAVLRHDPEAAYSLPLCVLAVDFLDREPRFDVVYQLRSMQHNDVARLIVQVTEDDPTVPTLERV